MSSFSKKRVLEILDQAQEGDNFSKLIDRFLGGMIVLNILAVSLESIEYLGMKYQQEFLYFEYLSIIVFGIEFLLRIWASSERQSSRFKSGMGRRLEYIISFNGLIDLLAIVPSIISLFVGNVDLRWVRVIRLLRIFKISNYSSALEDLISAVYEDRRSFLAALYLFFISLFFSSALMYATEHKAQPIAFSSIPESMWWSLITLTTVGYGDVAPITPFGKIIGAITAFMGVCTVALLTGIIASAFANQQSRKKQIFSEEIKQAVDDGVITKDEYQKIESLRQKLNLSEEDARAMIEVIYKK